MSKEIKQHTKTKSMVMNERDINIFQRALNECFDIDSKMSIKDAVIASEEYLINECPVDKY